MKTRALIVGVVVAVAVLLLAPAALAGWVTGIQYGLENITYYTYTPSTTGTLHIEISWTDSRGNASTYPVSEVDGVVQTYDAGTKELYYDVDVASLYAGTNPEVGDFSVKSTGVNKTIYIGVIPWIDDCTYHIVATFNGTKVIDQTGIAYGHAGELFLPSTANGGAWHSVMQYWPGTLNRSAGTSDVYANWDDYAYESDPAGSGTLADAWAVDLNSYVPPLVTDTPIDGRSGIANKWYVVGPEIWTGAARPNVWTNIATNLYPKPGTVTYTGAPLWYTWAYSDTAAPDAPAYFWAPQATTSAYGHCMSNTSSSAAKLAFSFYGTQVTWVYPTGPKGGIQKVSIDGTQVGTVDQYSSSVAYKVSRTFSGLSNGPHVLVVESTKTKNPASGGYFIYHDKFVAPGYAGDRAIDNENNSDCMTRYFFGKLSNANASGGTLSYDKSAQAPIAFTFSGTSITWKYVTGPKGGIQRVWIDGVDKGTVDQYSASVTYQVTKTFSGLPSGVHTILIKGSGSKNASSTGYFIYHDAFIVGSTTVED